MRRTREAFYLFVRITRDDMSSDDKRFVLDLLNQKHVLVVHGSGFSQSMVEDISGWLSPSDRSSRRSLR